MNTINKKVIYSIMFLFSITFIVFCSIELIDNMVTYKYHFEDFSEDVMKDISYESRKTKIEVITNYLIVSLLYLLFVTIYFLYKSKYNKTKAIRLIIIVSMLFMVFCFYELISYSIEYNDKIRVNIEQADIIVSYKQSKNELELIIGYLKIFIICLLTITSYISYKLFSKK